MKKLIFIFFLFSILITGSFGAIYKNAVDGDITIEVDRGTNLIDFTDSLKVKSGQNLGQIEICQTPNNYFTSLSKIYKDMCNINAGTIKFPSENDLFLCEESYISPTDVTNYQQTYDCSNKDNTEWRYSYNTILGLVKEYGSGQTFTCNFNETSYESVFRYLAGDGNNDCDNLINFRNKRLVDSIFYDFNNKNRAVSGSLIDNGNLKLGTFKLFDEGVEGTLIISYVTGDSITSASGPCYDPASPSPNSNPNSEEYCLGFFSDKQSGSYNNYMYLLPIGFNRAKICYEFKPYRNFDGTYNSDFDSQCSAPFNLNDEKPNLLVLTYSTNDNEKMKMYHNGKLIAEPKLDPTLPYTGGFNIKYAGVGYGGAGDPPAYGGFHGTMELSFLETYITESDVEKLYNRWLVMNNNELFRYEGLSGFTKISGGNGNLDRYNNLYLSNPDDSYYNSDQFITNPYPIMQIATTDGSTKSVNLIVNYADLPISFTTPSQINFYEDSSYTTDLKEHCSVGNSFSLINSGNSDLISTSLNNNILTIDGLENKYGNTEITIKCIQSDRATDNSESSLTIPVNVEQTDDDVISQNIDLSMMEDDEEVSAEISVDNIDDRSFDIKKSTDPLYGEATFSSNDDKKEWVLTYSLDSALNQDTTDSFKFKIDNKNEYEVTISISNSNQIPSSENIIINNAKEDNNFEILISEFTFEDEDIGDTFNKIKFSRLPNSNNMDIYTVNLDDIEKIVKNNDEINPAEYKSILVKPKLNKYGEGDDFDINFKVYDGKHYSNEYKIDIDISPENDIPEVYNLKESNKVFSDSITLNEEQSVTYSFIASDIETSNSDLEVEIIIPNSDIWNSDNIILNEDKRSITLNPLENAIDSLGTKILIVAKDEDNADSNSFELELKISNINDAPTSSDKTFEIYEGYPFNFEEDTLELSDIDGSSDINNYQISIISKPTGILKHNNIPIAIAPYNFNFNELSKLSYEPYRNIISNPNSDEETNSDSFEFRLIEGTENSESYSVNFNILPSPYGENSQPIYRGGMPIDEFWSCKPGYSIVVNSESLTSITKSCENINEAPTAKFTIGGLINNSAKIGDTIYLNAETSTDDNLDPLTYDWSINSTEIKPSFVLSEDLCTNKCNITLIVTDSAGKTDTITKSFNIVEIFEDLPENITEINYSNLIIQEGRTYNDEELAYLSLVKGSTIIQSGKSITIDSTGLITKVEALQSQTATGTGEGPKYYVNDGSCSTSLGENTVNSPEDCKQKSNGFGIILIFTFSILLGIGGFIAWKKGIFSKVSTKSSPMPSYEVPEYTEPVSTNNIQNNSVNLSSMIKEKINQGYSEGEIKNYLLSHGYSETDIDNAINS